MSLFYETELATRPTSYSSSGPITIQAGLHGADNRFRSPRKTKHILHWYAATDALALAIGLFGGWELSAIIHKLFYGHAIAGGSAAEFLAIGAALLAWFQQTGHYRHSMPFWIEIKRITAAVACAAIADGFLQFVPGQFLSRLWLLSGWLIAALAMVAMRNALRAYLKKKGSFRMRALLVGAGATASRTREAIESDHSLNYEIAAQIQDLPASFLQAGRSWDTLCAMHGVEYIIIALDGDELAAAEQPLMQLMRESLPFSVSPPLHQLPVAGLTPQYFMSHDVMLLAHCNGLEQSFPCFLKRAFDVAASAAALIMLSPLMLALALWVKSDGGPAFYAHMRLGRNKKPFPCLKFRSMVLNGDDILKAHLAENPEARQEWESTQKLINDPRITRVGKILRGTSLDELPQLINVLRGEMSMVGPRPIVNAEVVKYDNDFVHYCRVRPGVTGLWQVSGRSDVSYPRRVHMDSWYVRNWSLWHDIAILCKTVPALLNRKGAY